MKQTLFSFYFNNVILFMNEYTKEYPVVKKIERIYTNILDSKAF